jgi:CxxC motif-containing protein (DUF1111 family)
VESLRPKPFTPLLGRHPRSAVLVDIRFQSLTGRPYSVYVLHDVGLGLNANDDRAGAPAAGWSPPTGC